jgi:hypothetical protein
MTIHNSQRSDLCDSAAAREQVKLLRRSGFGRLLELIEHDRTDETSVFYKSGRLSPEKLGRAMGLPRSAVLSLLNDARLLVSGGFPYDDAAMAESV